MRVCLLAADTTVRSPAPETRRAVDATPSPRPLGHRFRHVVWWPYLPDVVLFSVLVVVALLVRRHGLPTNGLWLDDAEEGAGLKASPLQLLTVGFDHPGFIAAQMVWSRLAGSSAESLAYPALIAGTLSPGLLYLALRRIGYARSICALLGAALVVSETDIVYSGRVKTYTVDVLVVLVLALAIPRLARMKWRWSTALVWVTASLLLATFSGFAFIAVAAAAIALLLHPVSDFRIRASAVAVQGAAQVALFVAIGRTYNSHAFNGIWRHTWDAFLSFNPNPVDFGVQLLRHLTRITEVFPGGPGWFATMCVLIALIGLVTTAVHGRHAILARYLLLVLAIAFVGGILGRFPFGPRMASQISNGERASLWLVPVVAIGLAFVGERLRRYVAGTRHLVLGFDVLVLLATAAVLGVGLVRTGLPYPYPGAQSAAHFIDSQLGPNDAVLLPWPGQYSFATASAIPSGVQAQPGYTVGFWPKFGDGRMHLTGTGLRGSQVVPAVAGADRVFIYIPDRFNRVEIESRRTYATTLTSLHFTAEQTAAFGSVSVEVWRGTSTPNLKPSDFPRGWHTNSSVGRDAFSANVLACLHYPQSSAISDVVNATGANGHLVTNSEVIQWPTSDLANGAYAELTGSAGSGCIRSSTNTALVAAGYRTAVTATPTPPPVTGRDPLTAFSVTVLTADHHVPLLHGTLMTRAYGRNLLIFSYFAQNGQAFPTGLASNLAMTAIDRASSSN